MKKIITLLFLLPAFATLAQNWTGTDTIYMVVTVQDADTIIDTNAGNPDFFILDVRTAIEFNNAHIAGAINIDYFSPTFSADIAALDHNQIYLLHCASGGRSGPTFTMMQNMHFREVYHMNQGLNGWISAGYPTESTQTGFFDQADATEGISLYPNPVLSDINIKNELERPVIFYLSGINAQLLMHGELLQGINRIDVGSLAPGQYFLQIADQNEVITRIIIKN